MKFGATSSPGLTWALNTVVPALVARRYQGSRIVVFSTGNVYPFVDPGSGGCTEKDATSPVGEYAQSCLGRERVFEHYSREHATPCLVFRLFYAVDLRYGTLVDVARRVHAGQPVDLAVPLLQRDLAGRRALVRDPLARPVESPPRPLNVTGEHVIPVRAAAAHFGRLFGRSRASSARRAASRSSATRESATASSARLRSPPIAWSRGSPTGSPAAAARSERRPDSRSPMADSELRAALLRGLVIPAHPLALTPARRMDERRQVALTRYYCDAGAGGVAVGVHTTQFAIRTAGLLEPVLRLAAETVDRRTRSAGQAC